MVNYTLQQLRYLVAVAEHENVSAAARSLYVSQPGVSAAVSYLETTFGIQCFVRHHAKGMTLTPVGRSLVEAAKEVLTVAERLHHRASELAENVRGSVALGCCFTLSPFFLPSLLEILASTFPQINLQIHLGDVETLQRWLRDGTIEMALTVDMNAEPGIYSKHVLAQVRPHALLPESHPLAERASLSPADLMEDPLILLHCPRSADHLLALFNGARPQIRHRVSDYDLMRRLVGAGQGYALLNVLPSLDPGGHGAAVKWIPIRTESQPAIVTLASTSPLRSSARHAALLDACVTMMENLHIGNHRLAS